MVLLGGPHVRNFQITTLNKIRSIQRPVHPPMSVQTSIHTPLHPRISGHPDIHSSMCPCIHIKQELNKWINTIQAYSWDAGAPAKGVNFEKKTKSTRVSFLNKCKNNWYHMFMASQGPEVHFIIRVHFGVIWKTLQRGGFILASWSKVVFWRVSIILIPFNAYFLDSV